MHLKNCNKCAMKETSFNPKFKCCRYSLGPEFSGANRTLVPCTKNIDADAYVVDRLSWEKWMPSKNGLSKQQRRLTCLRKNLEPLRGNWLKKKQIG